MLPLGCPFDRLDLEPGMYQIAWCMHPTAFTYKIRNEQITIEHNFIKCSYSYMFRMYGADKLGARYDVTLSTLHTEDDVTGLRKTVCGLQVVLPRLAHQVRLVLSLT
jgi:aspartyl-tRNA synthetase